MNLRTVVRLEEPGKVINRGVHHQNMVTRQLRCNNYLEASADYEPEPLQILHSTLSQYQISPTDKPDSENLGQQDHIPWRIKRFK